MSDLDEQEEHEAERRAGLRPHVVHRAIEHEGALELERSWSGLAWSALAAGLSMGFSLVGEGVLRTLLPEARWTPLVAHLGYTLGFLFVIVGRQQLFTEHTLLAIIPLFARRDGKTFAAVCRLWAIVLAANLAGVLAFAAAIVYVPIFDDATRQAFQHVADDALRAGPAVIFARAIMAGWVIALMVWMLPVAEHSRFIVIVLMSYVVAVCQFAHVIAGAGETLYAVVRGGVGVGHWATHWFLPTLAGNAVGGVALVAALNHAQVESGEHADDERANEDGNGERAPLH